MYVVPWVSYVILALYEYTRLPRWNLHDLRAFARIIRFPRWDLHDLALSHTFILARVGSVWSAGSRFFCWMGPIWSIAVDLKRLPEWDLYDLDLAHTFALWGSASSGSFIQCLPGWHLYDMHDLHMFAECDLNDLRDLDRIYLMGSVLT